MKKLYSLLMLFAVLCFTGMTQAQNSWTVADGTDVHAKVPLDFWNTDGNGTHRAQMLYPASLLTDMAGNDISAITFYHQASSTKTLNYTWCVKMGVTDAADLSSGFSDVALTTVYLGQLVVSNGVFTFEFTTPYTYTGGNLIVEISTTGANGNYFGSSGSGCYGTDNIGSTYSNMSTPNYTAFLPKVTFTKAPTCFTPTDLRIGAIAQTNSTLSWTAPAQGSPTGYLYNYKKSSDAYWSQEYTTTATSVEISPLDANTSYDFRVRTNCGNDGESDYATISFKTLCNPTTLSSTDWTENFDALTAGSNVLPDCWNYINTTAYSTYKVYPRVYNYSAYSGSNCLYFNSTYSGYANYDPQPQYAILPMMADLTGKQITFQAKGTNAYSTFKIGTMTDPTDESTFTAFEISTGVYEQALTTSYQEFTYPLSGTNKCVAIMIDAASNNRTPNAVYIDDIVIGDVPSCVKPTSPNVVASGQTATFTWESDATQWQVAHATSSTAIPEDNIVEQVSTKTFTMNNLAVDEDHYFWVRANCGNDGYSEWVGPKSVHIGYCVPSPTSVDGNGISNVTFGTSGVTPTVNDDLSMSSPYYFDHSTMIGASFPGGTVDMSIEYATNYTYYTWVWVDWNNDFLFSEDEVVYPSTTTISSGTLTISFNVPSITALGDYRMRIQGADGSGKKNPCYTGTYSYLADYTLRVAEAPSCMPPTNLAVVENSATVHGASISWTAGGNETAWQICLNGNENNLIDVNTNSHTFTELDAATTYTVKVRANCSANENSEWCTPISFTTECEALTISENGWTENFDGLNIASAYTPTARVLPTCWSAINTTTYSSYKPYPSAYYYSSTNYANSTPNCLRFFSYYYSSSSTDYDPQPQYVILPEMSNLDGKRIKLQARGYYANSTFKIGRMTDPTDTNTFVPFEISTGVYEQSLTTSYQEFTYNIAGTGNYLAIMIDAATSSRSSNGVYIDDILVEPIPSCAEPSGLECTATTTTTATLSWTAGGTETAWDIFLTDNPLASPASYTIPTVSATTDNPTTVGELTAATTYYVWVRAHCSASDKSPWVGGISFNTACDAISDFPIIYTFETTDGFPTGVQYGSNAPSSNTLGACWRNISTTPSISNASRLWCTGLTAKNGSQSLMLPDKNSGNRTMLVFPSMNLTSNRGYVVSFWVYRGGSNSDSEGFKVYVSDVDTIGANAIELGHYSRNYNQPYPKIENNSGWYQYSTPVITMTGTAYLIFEGHSFYHTSTYIDDVTIEEAPSCVKPSNLTKNGVTAHTATLSWTPGNSETAWQIVFSTDANFDPDTVTPVDVTTNPATIDGLAQSTTYYAYVRANCGNDGYSDWNTTKATFTTDVVCPAPTSLVVTGNNTTANLNWVSNASSFSIAHAMTTGINPDDNIVGSATDTVFSMDNLTIDNDHYFWVRANCGNDGNSVWAGPKSVHIGYCEPSNSNRDGEGITGVTFGTGDGTTVNNSNAASGLPTSSPYYGDYTSMIGAVQAGIESTIAITTATSSWPYTFIIWVDFNNNLSFDDDEIVYTGKCSSGNGTLNATITVPPTQATGDYRMRISGADTYYNNFYDDGNIDLTQNHNPCQFSTSIYGVTHDYTLRVLEAPSCLPVGTLADATNITATSADLSWTLVDNTQNQWKIEIATNAEFDNFGITNTYITNPTLDGLTPETHYWVRVKAICGPNDYGDASNVIDFITGIVCPKPTDLAYSEVDQTSALLSWTENGNANNWVVAYKADGDADFTEVNNVSNPYYLGSQTALTQGTNYTVKVRANCGNDGLSQWSDPVSFQTEAACPAPQNLEVMQYSENAHGATITWTGNNVNDSYTIEYAEGPLTGLATLLEENFDGDDMPTGWSIMGLGTGNWFVNNEHYAGGDANEMLLYYDPSFDGISRLVTPPIDLTGITEVTFTFKHTLDYFGDSNTLGIATSSDGGTTWNVGWNNTYSGDASETVSEVISTSDMGNANVQFCIYYNGNSYNINYWYFDDITITAEYTPTYTWNVLATNVTNSSYQITTLDPETQYVVRVKGDCGGTPSPASNIVGFTTLEACVAPTAFTPGNVTTNEATFSWTAGYGNEAWKVYVKKHADAAYPTTFTNVSSTTATINQLDAGTAYDVKIVPTCDETKVLEVENAFTTACEAIAAQGFTENFEDYTGTTSGSTNNLPNCWKYINGTSYVNVAGYPIIYNNSSYSNSGNNFLRFYANKNQDPHDQYAILPEMNDLAGMRITLYARKYSEFSSNFKVGTMSDYTDASTFTEIVNSNNPDVSTSYQEFTFDIPTSANEHYVAIMMEASTTTTMCVCIDDISIDVAAAPVCAAPTALRTVTVGTDNASVRWKAGGEETNWHIQYHAQGENQWTTASLQGDSSNTFYQLTPGTTYEWQVQAVCGANFMSEWSATGTFTTTAVYTVTAESVSDFFGSVNGTAYVEFTEPAGTEITLTAIPAPGYEFTRWVKYPDTEMSTDAVYTFAVSEDARLIAYFMPKVYNISYELNQGSWVTNYFAPDTYTYSEGVTLPTAANVEYLNHTFEGWYDNAQFTGNPITVISTTAMGDTTLYAKWTIDTYDITLVQPANGTISSDPAQTAAVGAQVTLTATPNEGYSFNGAWEVRNTNNGQTVDVVNNQFTMPAGNVEVSASFTINEYTIAATANPVAGGTVTGANTYSYGAVATLTATANEGYSFVNWKEADTVVTTSATLAFEVKAARTFEAIFAANEYTITYMDGNTQLHVETLAYGANVPAYADPEKECFEFIGWSETIPTTMPANNVVLNAQWTELYYNITANVTPANAGSVTFDPEPVVGTTAANSGYICGTQVTLTATPAQGFSFAGWKVNGQTVSTDAQLVVAVSQDSTIEAAFIEDIVPVCEDTVLLTSVNDLAVGDVVFLVYEEGNNYNELSGLSNTSTIYGTYVSYVGKPAGVYPLTVSSGSTNGSFAFENNGEYLAWYSGNSLTTSTTIDENSSWTISINNGAATISNVGTTSRKIMWNSSSPRFACYTGGQKLVSLYKVTSLKAQSDTTAVVLAESFVWRGTTYPASGDYEVLVGTAANGCDSVRVLHLTLQQKVATPTFDPVAGNYTEPQTVTITCATDGANIYYTTDGSEPTENSTPYTSGIALNANTTVKAIAVKDGAEWVNSDVATAEYTFNFPTYTVTLNPGNGIVGQTSMTGNAYTEPVYLANMPATPNDACTDWTFAGWSTSAVTETTTMPTFVSDPYYPTADITLYAVYQKTEQNGQAVPSRYVKVTSEPNDWSGDYLIVYETGNKAFDGGLTDLDVSGNNIAVTINNGVIESNTTTDAAKFIIAKMNTTYSIKSNSGKYIGRSGDSNGMDFGNDAKSNSISLNNGNVDVVGAGGAHLRYNSSTNNGDWFRYYKSSTYTNQKAIQLYKYEAGSTPSTTTYNSNPDCAVMYQVNVDGNVQHGTIGADVTEAAEGATVNLTATPATGYHFGKWTVTKTNIPAVETVAVTNNAFTMPANDVNVSADFWIDTLIILVTPNPTVGGTVTGEDEYEYGTQVTVTATANSGYIFNNWTANGVEVSTDASFTFTATQDSDLIANFTAIQTVATPTFTPAAGTYTEPQTVTIACATEGASIYYTIDGSEPTANSTPYTAGIALNTNTTVKAIAVKDGAEWLPSEVATAAYTFNFPTYTVTLNPGSGTVGQTSITGNEYTEPVYLANMPATPNTACTEWTFAGWSTTEVTETTTAPTFVAEPYYPTADVTLYAVYQKSEQNASPTSTTASVDFSSGNLENAVITWTLANVVTITQEKNTSTTAPFYVSEPRWYKSHIITITPEVNVDSILIIATSASYANALFGSTYTNAAVSQSGTKIVVTPNVGTNPVTIEMANQSRVSSLSVSYSSNTATTTYNSNPVCSYMVNVDGNVQNGTISADKTEAVPGETVTLTATPATGYHFGKWEVTKANTPTVETVEVTNNTFEMPANDVNVSAIFWIDTLTIAATADPTEGGSVTGAGDYEYNTQVTLTATANEGYTFTGWTVNGQTVSTDAQLTFNVTRDSAFVATFTTNEYTITYMDGNTQLHVETLAYGANVPAYADPEKECFEFIGWNETIPATMPANNVVLYAQWNDIYYNVTVSADPNNGGTATITPDPVNGTTAANSGYVCNTQVTLTATANEGYTFTGWTVNGQTVSTDAQLTFNVTRDSAFVATFTINTYTITATANPTEGGNVTGGGTFDYGTQVTLTATPAATYLFSNWTSGGLQVSTEATFTFTATRDSALVANFTAMGTVATPTFNPVGGNFVDQVTVSISSTTPGVTIYYTLDGTDPVVPARRNVTGTQVYTDPITLTETTTIKAVAAKNDMVNSQMATETYRVLPTRYVSGWNTVNGTVSYTPDHDTTGATISVTATPDEGYHFAQWHVFDFDGNDVTVTNNEFIMPDTNVFVDAIFEPDTFDVTFVLNEGQFVNGYTPISRYWYQQQPALPTANDVKRDGFTFAGWYQNANLEGNSWTSIPDTAKHNLTYYAKWDVNSYDLTINYLDANGQTLAPAHTETLQYGAPYSVSTPDVATYMPDQTVVSGNMGTAAVTVDVIYTQIVMNAVDNQTVCAGGTTTAVEFSLPASLTQTFPNMTVMYEKVIDIASIGIDDNGYGNIAAFTAVNAGTDPVVTTVTVTPLCTLNNYAVRGVPQTFTITVNPKLTSEFSETVCDQYYWATADTTIVDEGTNDYVHVFTSQYGCDSTVTLHLTLYKTPTSMTVATTPNTSCVETAPNGAISITAPTGSFEYSINGTDWQTSTDFANLAANTYTVYVRPVNSECAYTENVTVNDNIEIPVATPSVDKAFYCASEDITLNSTGSSTGSDYAFAWSGPDGFTSTETSPVLANPLTGAQSGTYVLTITNTITGCVTEASVDVVVNTPSTSNYVFTVTTHGDAYANIDEGQTSVAPVFADPEVNHFMDGANVNYTVVNDAAASYDAVGDYTITWTATDECGNIATATQVLHVTQNVCPVANDVDGNTYPSVQIAGKCWMAKNLRTTKYSDNRPVNNLMVYENVMYPNAAENLDRYGYLYDWASAMDAPNGTLTFDANNNVQGICPANWHLPTGEDFMSIAGTSTLTDMLDLRYNNYWLDGGGNNSTNFSLLPGGCYNENTARYENILGNAYLWGVNSANPSQPKVYWADCKCYMWKVDDTTDGMGYSVRCIKD